MLQLGVFTRIAARCALPFGPPSPATVAHTEATDAARRRLYEPGKIVCHPRRKTPSPCFAASVWTNETRARSAPSSVQPSCRQIPIGCRRKLNQGSLPLCLPRQLRRVAGRVGVCFDHHGRWRARVVLPATWLFDRHCRPPSEAAREYNGRVEEAGAAWFSGELVEVAAGATSFIHCFFLFVLYFVTGLPRW